MTHCLSELVLGFSLWGSYLFMYLFGERTSRWGLSNINEMHSPDALALFECYVFPSCYPCLGNVIIFWCGKWGQLVYYFYYHCIYTALSGVAGEINEQGTMQYKQAKECFFARMKKRDYALFGRVVISCFITSCVSFFNIYMWQYVWVFFVNIKFKSQLYTTSD